MTTKKSPPSFRGEGWEGGPSPRSNAETAQNIHPIDCECWRCQHTCTQIARAERAALRIVTLLCIATWSAIGAAIWAITQWLRTP